MQGEADEITGLLVSWQGGDQAALERLLPRIQGELHRIARRHLARERKDHTMQPSSLIQEAFIRLSHGRAVGWRDRAHFFAAASCVMRHVLVDHARKRLREKRGRAPVYIPIDVAVVLFPGPGRRGGCHRPGLATIGSTRRAQEQCPGNAVFGGLSIEVME